MKKLVSLLLASLMVLAVAALPAYAEEQIELIFWTRMNDTFEDEIASFEELHPNVKVTRVGVASDYDGLVTKYVSGAMADELPHVGLISQRYGIPQIYDSGKLLSIELIMPEEEQNDIMPAFWERFTYKGERVVIPFQSSMPVLYYNKDLFEEHGVEVPTTWEGVMEAAKQLTLDTNGDGVTDVYGFNMPGDAPWYIQPLVWNMGGRIVHEDGSITVDTPEMVALMEDIKTMVHVDGSMPANQHATCKEDFNNGLLAMQLNSCASKGSTDKGVDGKFEYGIMMFPEVESLNVPIGGNALGIFKSTPEIEEMSWEFVKFMTSSDAIAGFTMNKGYVPIKYSFMESDLIQERMQDPIWQNVVNQVQYLKGQAVTPADATIWNETMSVMELIEADANTDVAAEVARIQQEVDDFIFEYE